MLKALVLFAGLTFAGAAAAQYKWTDQNGRVQYGDTPPSGVNAAPVRGGPSPSSSYSGPEAAEKKEDAKKPLTAAEQDAEFRKRRQAADKDREKQAQTERDAADKRDNCARAQENVRVLESGRVARTGASGERYFLDDAQLGQELLRSRQDVRDWCR
jgi:FKBP-type peptidyl-prolyl cis-trans isomerase